MKKFNYLFAIIILSVFIGCSDKPSNSMIDEQNEVINKNVQSVLGKDYEAINFTILEEGYTNEEKTTYAVKLTFDLNKSVMGFEGKQIPAAYSFEKKEGNWVCVVNSGNIAGMFNLLN
jgi:hypothetical protein